MGGTTAVFTRIFWMKVNHWHQAEKVKNLL